MIDAVGPIKIRARGAATAAVGEARVLLTNVAWPLYQAIAGARGDRSIPRLTYVDGELELMSPSFRHETLARRLGTFILMLARGLGRPCPDAGSARWERMGLDKGKEPDACFYLGHEPAVRGLREIDLEIHPPPDLAIEVEITHALTDAFSRLRRAGGARSLAIRRGVVAVSAPPGRWNLRRAGGEPELPHAPIVGGAGAAHAGR
jgi:Putative restriction endonuclease